MLVSPSILTCDFAKLEKELASVNNANYLHLDIMDGHFVSNLSFGPYISSIISQKTKLPLDIHLMVTDPLLLVEKFSFKNTNLITIHAEANNVKNTLLKIKSLGHKAGISIKPNTKVSEIANYLSDVDLVLVMSVEPGYGGQKFLPSALEKIKELSTIRKDNNFSYLIEVDGGINEETSLLVWEAGADMIVVGSYLFNSKNRKQIIKKLQAIK